MPMTNDQISYWECVRAVCCRAWGIPPWHFDEALEAGRVDLRDIERTIELARIESADGEMLVDWIRPGTMDQIREEVARLEEEKRMRESWMKFQAQKGR